MATKTTKNISKNEEEKRYRFSVAIIILLAIVIIWLLLVNFFGFRGERVEKIHIFDLSFCQTCGNSDVPETGGNGDSWQSEEEHNNKQPETDVDGYLTVFDKDITWGATNQLNIFEDSLYDNRNKIAPHSTNTYEFIIRNRTGVTLSYNIAFEEYNPNKINMKYRLIKDGIYVAGDSENWVTFSELTQTIKSIQTNINDVYYLEWMWFDNDNDTEIGEMNDAEYSIKINIKAVQVTNAN